jgi:alanine racemase
VNRYGTAAQQFRQSAPEALPWTTKIEAPGVMDLITVDLSTLPDCGMGSEVTLWGSSSQGHLLPIDEVAQSAGSIGYELMCALAARVPVEVLD